MNKIDHLLYLCWHAGGGSNIGRFCNQLNPLNGGRGWFFQPTRAPYSWQTMSPCWGWVLSCHGRQNMGRCFFSPCHSPGNGIDLQAKLRSLAGRSMPLPREWQSPCLAWLLGSVKLSHLPVAWLMRPHRCRGATTPYPFSNTLLTDKYFIFLSDRVCGLSSSLWKFTSNVKISEWIISPFDDSSPSKTFPVKCLQEYSSSSTIPSLLLENGAINLHISNSFP